MHANLGVVLGHLEHDLTPGEEFAPKPDSSPHPELCPLVKGEEVKS